MAKTDLGFGVQLIRKHGSPCAAPAGATVIHHRENCNSSANIYMFKWTQYPPQSRPSNLRQVPRGHKTRLLWGISGVTRRKAICSKQTAKATHYRRPSRRLANFATFTAAFSIRVKMKMTRVSAKRFGGRQNRPMTDCVFNLASRISS